MEDRSHMGIPLIGALLIEAGLITMEQLQVCMLLQSENYLGIPIGQILVNCGYISQSDLSHILILQSEIRSSILTTFDERIERPADLTALICYRHNVLHLITLLQRLGVAAVLARDWAGLTAAWRRQPPDLILIDPGLIPPTADLEEAVLPVLPLPLESNAQSVPPWVVTVLSQFVEQVRDQRTYRQATADLRRRDFELNTIATINQIFTTIYPIQDALSKLMIRIRDLLDVEAGVLYRLDWPARQLVSEVTFGPQSTVLEPQRVAVGQGIAGWVARYRRSLIVADVAQDPRFNPQIDQQPGCPARTIICLPLIAFGEVHGVIELINKLHGESFTKRDLLLLRVAATMVSLTQTGTPVVHEPAPSL